MRGIVPVGRAAGYNGFSFYFALGAKRYEVLYAPGKQNSFRGRFLLPSAAEEDGGAGKEQNGGGSGDGGNNRERFGVSFKNGSR